MVIKLVLGLSSILLAGCNTVTPSEKVLSPYFINEEYQELNCHELKLVSGKQRKLVQELSLAQDKRVADSVGHTIVYGWGVGDGVETIELIKAKGEMNAARKEYENQGCSLRWNEYP